MKSPILALNISASKLDIISCTFFILKNARFSLVEVILSRDKSNLRKALNLSDKICFMDF